MSDGEKKDESEADVPLDQTEPPMDMLQEGDGGDTPLDKTEPEMDHFYGSDDHPRRPRPRG